MHDGILEGGALEGLVLAWILALQLPCLALTCQSLDPLRALRACALSWSVNVLHKLAGRLGRGWGLPHLLRRGHGRLALGSLG